MIFGEGAKVLAGPFTLLCSCGAPLEVGKYKPASSDGHWEWYVGHVGCDQSPGIHGRSAEQVLSLLCLALKKFNGRMPTKAEHLAETDKGMLEFDHSDSERYEKETGTPSNGR